MPNEKRRGRPIQRPNKTILSRTLVLLAVCGIVAFVVLTIKLYQVQILKHDYYEGLAIEQQTRQATIVASRGTVFDTNGKILAMSASVENVFISPKEVIDYEEDANLIAAGLEAILGADSAATLEKMKDTQSQYKTIKLQVERETAELVREFIKEHGLKSIHLEPATKRYYPYSSLACQVIGFVGTDNTGLEGLESQYDSYLTGTNGRVVRLKNRDGRDMLFTDFEDYYDAQNGNDVALTLDATIQYYIEKHLAQAIEDYDVQKGGAAIAMRPDTGEILAMASMNNFDLNNYLEINEKEQEKLALIADEDLYNEAYRDALFSQQRNKALADTYEPGSVFKIITMAMALEEGIVDLDDTFTCNGTMTVEGRTGDLHCWKAGGHGTQTLTKAMMNSCNVALVKIGLRVGPDAFYKYSEAFGLFDKTGFDLPGESRSIWWPKNVFFNPQYPNYSQLAAASFGQTLNITPLQLITAVSSAVNGGNLMQPYVVKQISDSNGGIITATEPQTVRQVISHETSDTLRTMLEEVVKTGTGKNAQVRGYRVGGKTGTSEKIAQLAAQGEDAVTDKEYIVSFCGFAPADDPEIVILLLLDTPSHETGIYISGGNMAAPVVGNMLADILPYMGIAPHYSEEDLKEINVPVPRLVSKNVADALASLADQGLEYKIVGEGDTVTGQLPSANAQVAVGTKVILYVGEETPQDAVTVPDLRGMSYEKAKAALEERGLFIRSNGASRTMGGVSVSKQSVPVNEFAAYGTVIEVTLIDKSVQGNY